MYERTNANPALDIMKGAIAYNAVRSLHLSVPREIESPRDNAEAKKLSSEPSPALIQFTNASFAYHPSLPPQPALRASTSRHVPVSIVAVPR